MKNSHLTILIATVAGTMAMTHKTNAAGATAPEAQHPQGVPTYILQNEALISNPRVIEEYPELVRFGNALKSDQKPRVRSFIRNNVALLDAPRTLEKYPQLERMGYLEETNWQSTELDRVLQNAALSDSPRMREEFPCLELQNCQRPAPIGKSHGSLSQK
jgi:hypothetical protein